MKQNVDTLERRVVRAAETALQDRQFVTAIDVLVGIGWVRLFWSEFMLLAV